MKICIVGGGNIVTLLAAELSSKGHHISIYTSKPESWSKEITAVDVDRNILYQGEIRKITNDIHEALIGAHYIFVTLPSIAQKEFAEKAAQFVEPGMKFVMVPGYGGTELLMRPIIESGAILVGMQRVHAISRIVEYGKYVCMRGRKDSVQIAVFNHNNQTAIVKDIQTLLDMPVLLLPTYLAITFTPSNPVLHTSRLYCLFKKYHEGVFYPSNIYFYDDWNDESSRVMLKLDSEVQKLCKCLDKLDLSSVRSLREHYESYSVESMTYKLSHIKAFKGILSPMKKTAEGWIPDFENRYFSCDFEYGLEILHNFAQICGLNTPMMDEVMDWYRAVTKKNALGLVKSFYLDKAAIYNAYSVALK